MDTSWGDWIRRKCSFSIIFSTALLLPTPRPFLFFTPSSNPRLFPDPFSQLGDARVDAGLVPTSAAFTPAHNSGLEPLPTLLETHQGSSGVSLVSRGVGWVIGLGWDVQVWQPIYVIASSFHSILGLFMCCMISPGMRQLLRPRIHCRASWRWLCPQWLCYTLCRWWFSPSPSAAPAPSDLQVQDKGVSAPPRDLCVHHQHQKL